MNNLTYLFVAYSLIWLGLFSYVVSLHLGQRQLRKRIDSLRERVRARGGENAREASTEPQSHQLLPR